VLCNNSTFAVQQTVVYLILIYPYPCLSKLVKITVLLENLNVGVCSIRTFQKSSVCECTCGLHTLSLTENIRVQITKGQLQ